MQMSTRVRTGSGKLSHRSGIKPQKHRIRVRRRRCSRASNSLVDSKQREKGNSDSRSNYEHRVTVATAFAFGDSLANVWRRGNCDYLFRWCARDRSVRIGSV